MTLIRLQVYVYAAEIVMRVYTIALKLAILGLLVSSATCGQSQTVEQAKFQIEIQAAADGGPKFTVANLSGKTLTACTFQFSVSSESRAQSKMDWDPLAQGRGDPGRPGPLEPGASLTMDLPHKVGGPLPDRVEVIAGIWEDGETFGQAVWVKTLLDHRASLTSAYEQAISMLQKGLDENWTRGQYLAALNSKPNSLPFYSIRSTLEANSNSDQDPRPLQLAMKNLLQYFTGNLTLLHKTKLPVSDTTSR